MVVLPADRIVPTAADPVRVVLPTSVVRPPTHSVPVTFAVDDTLMKPVTVVLPAARVVPIVPLPVTASDPAVETFAAKAVIPETFAVPVTWRVALGAPLPIPIRLLTESTNRVAESKDTLPAIVCAPVEEMVTLPATERVFDRVAAPVTWAVVETFMKPVTVVLPAARVVPTVIAPVTEPVPTIASDELFMTALMVELPI